MSFDDFDPRNPNVTDRDRWEAEAEKRAQEEQRKIEAARMAGFDPSVYNPSDNPFEDKEQK